MLHQNSFVNYSGDSDPSLDIYPTSGSILLSSGLSQVDLVLEVLDDTDPELEETFTVILSQPTGGANLDLEADRSTFTIRYLSHIVNHHHSLAYNVQPES